MRCRGPRTGLTAACLEYGNRTMTRTLRQRRDVIQCFHVEQHSLHVRFFREDPGHLQGGHIGLVTGGHRNADRYTTLHTQGECAVAQGT